MNLLEFSKNELEKIEKQCEDDDGLAIQKLMTKNLMDCIQVFSDAHFSGFSANYAINALTRLLSYKPLTPLTGEDDEWEDVSQYQSGKKLWQNKRCREIFKDENNNAYWVSAKYFSDDEGHTWYTSQDSSIPVTFPFNVPDEPEYIIIDNKERRYDVKKSIYERLDTLFDNELPAFNDFDDNTTLSQYITESDLPKFNEAIKTIHNIDKFSVEPDIDIYIWQLITLIIDSENK